MEKVTNHINSFVALHFLYTLKGWGRTNPAEVGGVGGWTLRSDDPSPVSARDADLLVFEQIVTASLVLRRRWPRRAWRGQGSTTVATAPQTELTWCGMAGTELFNGPRTFPRLRLLQQHFRLETQDEGRRH